MLLIIITVQGVGYSALSIKCCLINYNRLTQCMVFGCFLHAHFLVGEEGRGAKGCEWGGGGGLQIQFLFAAAAVCARAGL
jgi:hypothetical protein